LEVLKTKSEANESSPEAFVKFLYETHKPKGEKPEIKEDFSLKKILLSAIAAYHPDKNRNKDEKWQFLVCEITKYLNNFYTSNCK
jgi:hypothetical protein